MAESMIIPPWMSREYADPATTFLNAFKTGAAISQFQQELAQKQHENQVSTQLQREKIQQEALQSQAQLAATQAYHEMTNKIQMGELEKAKLKTGLDIMKAKQEMASPQFMPENKETGAPAYLWRPGGAPTVVKPEGDTASIRDVKQITDWENQANQAASQGDTDTAKALREQAGLLREQMKGQQIVMGYDDQGRPQFQIGKGASPTVATASRAQQKLQKYENATEIINRLQSGLDTGHVGLAGLAGEYLWDRGMVQLANLMGDKTAAADPNRVNSRAGLIMLRESLMREISDDSRFSNLDREEISKALPSSGAFESLSDAKQKLSTVRDIISQRSKVYSKSIGGTPPLFSMSAEEIRELFKQGKLTREQALNALTRFH